MNRPKVTEDLPEWPGWKTMNCYLAKADETPYPEDSKNYTVITFETGCRRAEAITIRKDQVSYNEEAIIIRRVPVLKHRATTWRDIVILRDDKDPWAETLVEYVESLDHEYLYPARNKFSRGVIPGKHTTGRTLYNRISEIDTELLIEERNMWPHGLRGMRASMLVSERDFSLQMLMKWFEWARPDMAIHYTKTRDLARAMGIKKLPT